MLIENPVMMVVSWAVGEQAMDEQSCKDRELRAAAVSDRSMRGRTRRELLGTAAFAGAAALAPASLRGQERYPSRAIRIIVPFPAGATTDMLARLFAQRMTETMGQRVVVEN